MFLVGQQWWLTILFSVPWSLPFKIHFVSPVLRWLTFLIGYKTDSHSPVLYDLFLSSDVRICSTMAFPPLGNYDHVFVSVSVDFPSNSQQDTPFHDIAYAILMLTGTVFVII